MAYPTEKLKGLSTYHCPQEVEKDVKATIAIYKDLRVKSDNFVFNDGSSKDLVNMDGTIPVNFRGTVYNIPICVWLLETHPLNPPIVYVKPTNTMRVKVSGFVDISGKIDIPYIRDWLHPVRASLLDLVTILVTVFSETPPVYAVTRIPPYPQGPNPFPTESTIRQSFSNTQSATPYPRAGAGFMPMPTPSTTTVGGSNPYSQGVSESPYPYPTANRFPYPQPTPYPAYTDYQRHSQPPYGTGYPPHPSLNLGQAQTGGVSGTNTVTEEHLRVSLLSAVEDKARRKLQEMFDTAQVEMEVLYKTQRELQTGQQTLQTQIQNLTTEKANVEQKIEAVKEKDREMKALLSRMQNQEKLSIDEAVVTPAPLYKQLLNAFAEEQAVEDGIYYLGEALRRNVIDLDVFLKHVRELSRKQFMLRAIIQKCREKAGLPLLT